MKRIFFHITFLGLFFLMQSCIKENLPACDESVLQLRYKYTLNNQYTNLFELEVQRVTAYIFDASGKYTGTYTESGEVLTNDYIMRIPLPPGNYHAVVFCDNLNTFSAGRIDAQTNMLKKDLEQGTTDMADFRIELNSLESEDGYLIPETLPGNLYAGYASNLVSSDTPSDIREIDLMKDTKKIKLKLSGLDILTRSSAYPEIYIIAVNGRYKNENSIDTSYRMFKFTPYSYSFIGDTLESQLKIMRLVIDSAPTLIIKNPLNSDILFNQEITKLIQLNPQYKTQVDIDREDQFLIGINFSKKENEINISLVINGWTINNITPY